MTAEELRILFNRLKLYDAVQRGELSIAIKEDRHPRVPKSGDPHCTHSQMVGYYDAEGREVAVVHQFLRPDGTLGASKRPDPKKVLHEGVKWKVRGD